MGILRGGTHLVMSPVRSVNAMSRSTTRAVRAGLRSRVVSRKPTIAAAMATSIAAPSASSARTHVCMRATNAAYEDAVIAIAPVYVTSAQRTAATSAVAGPTRRKGDGRMVWSRWQKKICARWF